MKEVKVYDETLIDPEFMGGLQELDLQQVKRDLKVVTCFSTLFCKWELQEDGLLVQIFPRSGAEDEWYEARYLQQCANCGVQRKNVRSQFSVPPCHRCGSTRLVFMPGREETSALHRWALPLEAVENLIKRAGDRMFLGNVKFDYVEELNSFVLLFERWSGSEEDLHKAGGPLDTFLEEVDNALTPSSEG